ncbi:hypothetical protein ACFV7R_29885 [Streptomyces sp. NPDC059866]|uniref:hypothetical protein n=1 Tax=Streptomyces sp. NPDC059866 TaxID=3346978 RepID=UPI00365E94F0
MPQQTTTPARASAPPSAPPPQPVTDAYRRQATEVACLLDVDPAAGLTSAAVALYDNIVTSVRFQLSTNTGAILTLLATVPAGLPSPCQRSSFSGSTSSWPDHQPWPWASTRYEAT